MMSAPGPRGKMFIVPPAPKTSADPVAELLSRLPGAKPSGSRWMAKCPAHRDDKPSLQVARGDDGRALVVCFAGCSLDSILAAVGMSSRELFTSERPGQEHKQDVVYTYHDEGGKIAYQVVRQADKQFKQRRPNGGGHWVWNMDGVKRIPYRLPELLSAPSDHLVFVVEGEKDVDRLSLYNLTATTNSGGAERWTDEHSEYLRGRHVVILPDNDISGYRHAQKAAKSLSGVAESVCVVNLPGLPPGGDVSDWLDAGHKIGELKDLIAVARPWTGEGEEEEGAPAAPDQPDQPDQPLYRIIKVWEEEEPAPRRFAIQGLVPDEAVTLFYGDGGQGKSYIAMHMACTAAQGRPFLGRFVERRPAIYLDAELDSTEFVRRAYSLARGYGLSRPPEGLHYFNVPGSMSDPTVQEIVRQAVMACEAGFVVFDSLTIGSAAVDSNEAAPMIKVLKFLESLKVAAVAIDHIPKPLPGTNASQYRAYGTVMKGNVARSSIQIVRAEAGGLSLLHKKSNFAALSDPLHLALEFEDNAVSVVSLQPGDSRLDGAEETLSVVDQVLRELSKYDDGARPDFLASELGKSTKTIKNHLSALAGNKKARAVGDGTWIAVKDGLEEEC